MPRFEPFRALRYAAADRLATLTSPPYDVLSPSDIEAYAASDPHNVVHVDDPRVVHADAPDPYAESARLLREWVADGTLVHDAEPTLTIHRMRFTDSAGAVRETVGVLGGLEVVDAGAGGVLPHERTTPKDSSDRLDLTRATKANLSPVWGLSLASGLTDALSAPADEVGRVTLDRVEHVLERVTDPERLAAVEALIGSDDVLIADGHHRYGVARAYRDEVGTAAATLTLTYVQELTPDQLSIAAIHRLYEGLSLEDVRATLARSFDLSPAPELPPEALLRAMFRRGALVLVGPDGAEWLDPREGAFDGIRALDGAWLEHAFEGSGAQVRYQHGVEEVAAAVRDGRATAAVLIRPTSVAEIMRTAREGVLMPPKSTFFTPKLPTGFVIRDLTV